MPRFAPVGEARLEPSARIEKLWKLAVEARKKSYSPYSKFAVGAALEVGSETYTGCNVENASYGGTVCAERTAILKAVSEGAGAEASKGPAKRSSFKAVVIVTEGPKAAEVTPCALCLQMMAEFCGPDFDVWVGNSKKLLARYRFAELLPHPFGPDKLL